jgi:hypothetical protein
MLCVGFFLATADARADVPASVTSRVLEQWKERGATVERLPSVFVFDNETIVVPVSPEKSAGCTYVALIAARGLGFHARLEGALREPIAPSTGGRASSVAGALELHRCGAGPDVRQVILTSNAGRGAVEVVVASSAAALPVLATVIPERTGGVLPQVPDVGPLLPVVSTENRADMADNRGLREGAKTHERVVVHANEDGGGDFEIGVEPGCHRIELLADEAPVRNGRRLRVDVDAELRDGADGDTVLARDRTESPDARLEACVAARTSLTVVFAGAPPLGRLVATRSSWSLPPHLPLLWGPLARGRIARAMLSRHVAAMTEEPAFVAQGTSGTTPLPLTVEPGACYVAAVALTHGHARALHIRALVGARESLDERGSIEGAALAAFCVRAFEPVRLDVHARGTNVGWGLALYRVRSGVWEAP